MISGVAVLGQPPLLVPELMGSAARSAEPVRAASREAVHRLTQLSSHWMAVAPATEEDSLGPCAAGTFRPYGVDVPVSLTDDENVSGGSAEGALPLPALVAGWLRECAGAKTVRVELVPDDLSTSGCRGVADRLARTAAEPALLVLGDGSNRRGAKAPGGPDERAETFDTTVAQALGSADTAALRALDPGLAAQLGATGRASWQVLAALAGDAQWRAELLYSDAPFGVGYHVAVWERM